MSSLDALPMPHDATGSRSPQSSLSHLLYGLATAISFTVVGWSGFQLWDVGQRQWANFRSPPLAMRGGDPYLRAMMRTISAAEASGFDAYRQRFPAKTFDVSRGWQHPNICETVPWRQGYCSTAAGRYQMLWSTWQDWASRAGIDTRSFSPENQDLAVYQFLASRNVQPLLHSGRAHSAFCELGRAAIWTSMPCGTETNRHTASLLSLYEQFLEQERQRMAIASQQPKSS
ncbi:MAG: glycoside hydrolase family protein [Cyanobacteria bacterium P01_D01_bin.123]